MRWRYIQVTAIGQLHLVGTMHERKALMAELPDAFLVLPRASALWGSKLAVPHS